MKISVIAAAYRVHLWELFINSLKTNTVDFEVIFVGHIPPDFPTPKWFKYIKTADIKPAQCYEIARREAKGELIHWTADDAEYSEGCLDKICDFWDKNCGRKDVLSMQTKENGHVCSLNNHTFFAGKNEGALMAPLGIMNREYLIELGGFDRRFIYGQYENDVVLRIYEAGGKLHKYEVGDAMIDLDHNRKHVGHDRLLETHKMESVTLNSFWLLPDGTMSNKRLLPLEQYEDEDSLTKSQSNKGMWI